MARKCQILQRKPSAEDKWPPWRFAAHGATWSPEEAAAHIALLKAHGWQVRKVAI
jgi:hypothetical protein